MIDKEMINRINELSRKQRSIGLTEEEKAEQQQLRRQYLDDIREQLSGMVENIEIVEKDGSRTPVRKKIIH